jgi:hypothetical protein
MTVTYEPIVSQTLSANAANVTFTAIPGTYTDLVLVITGKGTTGNPHYMQVNSDTGGNYSWNRLLGTGTGNTVTRANNDTLGYRVHSGNGDVQAVMVIHVMSYANTNVFKPALIAGLQEGGLVFRQTGVWRSTSAITSMTLYNQSGNWVAGATFSLYGIKAA